MKMTFHESYGELPAGILRLIKEYNVSPADYDLIVECAGTDWVFIRYHILTYSTNGYYNYNPYI